MSFGFSPGDIVAFIQFAAKVVSALKEEDGSKSEYQLAEQQCQGFLDVMEELKNLDLSNVQESFRNKLAEYSKNVQGFTNDFKKTIARYEKSMGESSGRGLFRSAPRKVQWAVMAANDLGKFRQSLDAQLNLVKIVIQISILSIVGNYHQQKPLLLGTAQNLSLRPYRSIGRMQGNIGWGSNTINSFSSLHTADDLADLVYDRLLTRRSMPLRSHGRVHTLQDDTSVNMSHTQLNVIPEERDLQFAAAHMAEPLLPAQQEAKVSKGRAEAKESDQSTLAGDINDYLLSMSLEGLSEQEKEYIRQGEGDSPRLLLEAPGEETVEPHHLGNDNSFEESQPSDDLNGSQRRSRFGGSRRMFSIDPMSALGIAANVVQFVDFAARLSVQVSEIYNSVDSAPRELLALSNRLIQYSQLLDIVAGGIRTSTPDRQLEGLYLQVIQEGQQALGYVKDFMAKFTATRSLRLARVLKWKWNRKHIIAIMEEIESFKSTLSITLQLFQINMMERQAQMTEVSFDAMKIASEDASISLRGTRSGVNRDGKHRYT